MEKIEIAKAMGEKLGVEVKEELVIKLPDDGCPGHLNSPHWDVYAARAGEFTILAYVYDDGNVNVHVV